MHYIDHDMRNTYAGFGVPVMWFLMTNGYYHILYVSATYFKIE